MKRKIYKLLSNAKRVVFALALTVFSGAAYSQVTHTFLYTGSTQSIALPAGSYSIECWGADGGNGNITLSTTFGGKGGYSNGVYTNPGTATLNVYVGGHGGNASGTSVGGGGGGMSDVTTSTNTNVIIIAAGGGGGGTSGSTTESSIGGGGGGLVGGSATDGSGVDKGTSATGGSQIAGGFAVAGSYGAGNPGGYGYGGGSANGSSTPPSPSGTMHAAGGIGGNGGNGGWNGGGAGCTGTNGNNHSGGGGAGYYGGGGGLGDGGAGGGGSGYIGGVTGGTTIMFGQTGFVANPDITGNGRVIIRELCNITLSVTGVNSSGLMCAGNSVTLTTNAISNYVWSNGATSSSIVVSPTSNTIYSLTATSPSNCTASAMITVSVSNSIPVLSVINTANAGGICPNSTVMLTASGAITYTWAGGSITPTNGIAFGPIAPADYTVSGANGCGTSTAVTSVSVHSFPTVNPSASSTTLCAGGTLSLIATGNATNYAWSGGSAPSGNNVGFIPPASTVTYSVIGTSALSCTALATIPVTVHATPNAAPAANPILVCLGESSTLTAAGATTYTWASSTNTVFTNTFVVTPSATGVTTYTITKANSTCSDTKMISITTNSLPGIFAMVTPTVVCALKPATLTIGGGTSYTWTAPGTPNFSFTGASPVVYPQAPAEYTVAASDGTCISVTTVSLSVDPNPTITLSASAPSLCVGAAVTMTALGGNSYTWTSSSSTSTLFTQIITESPTIATSYNVTGNNSFGCTASANQVVIVHNNPTLTVTASKNLVCSGDPSTLTASGANTYTWDPNNALTPTTIVNPVALSSGPVEYTVSGSYSSTGCMSTKTIQVNVYMPVLTITGNTNTCKDGQISLSASGGNPNTYSWNTGTNTFNFPTVTTTLSAPAIFTVSATSTSVSVNTAVCPVSQAVAVGIHFNPTITAVADRTTIICQGESVELRADGALTYTWSNSFGGATITVIPPFQTNNYVVRGTDINGCVASATVQVKINSCLGIQESSKAALGLVVYPNPNKGTFTIESGSNLDLVIANELGQVVRSIILSGDTKYAVTVNDLAKGIYFLSSRNSGSQVHQKIIVD